MGKDIKIEVKSTHLVRLSPTDRRLVLDVKRHMSGIMYALIRWLIESKQQVEQGRK